MCNTHHWSGQSRGKQLAWRHVLELTWSWGGSRTGHGPHVQQSPRQWRIQSEPLDALQIDAYWIDGIAHVDANTVTYADHTTTSCNATKT